MPMNILMPALSPTMEKGNLSKWLKKEGDKVQSGDVIAEIETDKATMEVEAIDDGVIAKIVVPEGTQDVPVNDVIAILAAEGEDVNAAASGKAPAKSEAPKAEAAKPDTAKADAPKAAETPKAVDAPKAAEAPKAASAGDGQRVFASPLARRLAKDAGIDISRVSGSGPHGRVIASDVDKAKSGGGLKAAPATSAAAFAAPAGPNDQQIRAMYKDGDYEVVPHDGMRKTIAQRLTTSARDIPHFFLTVDCNIDKLLAAREEINASAPKNKEGKPAFKLSVNDFVIKALAVALQRVPDANVTWTEGAMLKHTVSDISVAVSIPSGLITPVIRNAHLKTVSAISAEMKDLAARARARKLKPEEYQGGTSSVSNLGMYGIKDFTAVINPPQSTILAVGAGEQRAVVKNGKIEVANVMSVTMSCDHRAVDGALGAELVSAFRMLIENPVMMIV